MIEVTLIDMIQFQAEQLINFQHLTSLACKDILN